MKEENGNGAGGGGGGGVGEVMTQDGRNVNGTPDSLKEISQGFKQPVTLRRWDYTLTRTDSICIIWALYLNFHLISPPSPQDKLGSSWIFILLPSMVTWNKSHFFCFPLLTWFFKFVY